MADNDFKDDDFEDADFEDIEPVTEEDDLGDEPWDDEDSFSDDLSATDSPDEGAAPSAGKKTFVQKNFVFIVVGVVALFGGAIALSLMSGADPSTPVAEETATNSEIVELSDQSALPPMPAPINAAPQETLQEPVAAEDNALTPLPTPQDLQNTELAELTVEEIPATPAAAKTTPQGEEPFDYKPADENRDGAVDASEQLNAEFRERAQTAPATDVETSDFIAPTLENPADEAAPANSVEPAPTLANNSELTQQLEAKDQQIAELQTRLTEAEAEAKKSQAAIEKSAEDSIKAKDERIAELSQSVAELEKKLAAAQEAQKAAEKTAQSASQKSPPQETAKSDPPPAAPLIEDRAPAKAATPPLAKPAADNSAIPSKPKTVKAAPQWQLKSAQPGKAMIASRSTGDIRNVAVGDRIDGLGKITSIAKENNRWVVRGSSSSVSQ